MQETEYTTTEGNKKLHQEFFEGKNENEVEKLMDSRLLELKEHNHKLIKRVKIGRNEQCPCHSGLKFKKCCIFKMYLNKD